MFELLAEGGQFVAILTLCVTCWIAGRSVRETEMGSEASDGLAQSVKPDEIELAFLHGASFAHNAGRLPQSIANLSARAEGIAAKPALSSAHEIHELIRTGDLSEEGVIQSLVALAEEQTELENTPDEVSWRSVSQVAKAHGSCDAPRFLTRRGTTTEPRPADLVDPLTPEVLSRYRVYAEEYGHRV